MANVLREVFGNTKRISILEEMVENWGEFLTIEEIARIAETSPKTAYRHVNELNKGIKKRSDKIKKLKAGQKIALISTLVLSLLALLKAIVGYRFDSHLLIADAFHSGGDILINFTSLLGLWLASKEKYGWIQKRFKKPI